MHEQATTLERKHRIKINGKWLRLFLTFLITIFVVIVFSKPTPFHRIKRDGSIQSFSHQADTIIPIWMNNYDIPGVSIALVKDAELIWSQSYGVANQATYTPLMMDTRMRVQSISKSLTAWGIMRLVEQGKIELDRPIENYLKQWRFPDNKYSTDTITIRQLLTHSAGFPIGDFYNYYSPTANIPSLEASLSREAILIQKPGTSFFYSNIGYNLLELLIEEVTGRDFSEFMHQEILEPLEMQHSSFLWNSQWNPAVPNGYNLQGKPVPVYVYPEKGSGGLFSTSEDIANFLIASMAAYNSSRSVLSTDSINTMYTIWEDQIGIYNLVFDGYGFGHYIEQFPDGRIAIAHGGQGTGWMTHFHAYPQSGDGIVILTNSQRSWPLIANLLSEWAKWSELPVPGMSCITLVDNILWGVVGVIWFIIFWVITDQIHILRNKGSNKFHSVERFPGLFWIKAGISLLLTISLFWCSQQPYLFITSVFPRSATCLGYSLQIFSIFLFISAFTPKRKVSMLSGSQANQNVKSS